MVRLNRSRHFRKALSNLAAMASASGKPEHKKVNSDNRVQIVIDPIVTITITIGLAIGGESMGQSETHSSTYSSYRKLDF